MLKQRGIMIALKFSMLREEESGQTGRGANTVRRRHSVDFIHALPTIQGHGRESERGQFLQ